MLQQLGFLWAVTGVVWIGTAFYTISLLKRQSRLQHELQQLEKTLTELQRNIGEDNRGAYH